MKIYKIIFTSNTITSIIEADGEYYFTGDIYYYKNKGFLVYAIIKATTESEARLKAEEIIKQHENKSKFKL